MCPRFQAEKQKKGYKSQVKAKDSFSPEKQSVFIALSYS